MIFNGFCPLLNKDITEGRHIEIVAELIGLKTKDDMKTIKRDYAYKSFEQMSSVCENCPNFPQV